MKTLLVIFSLSLLTGCGAMGMHTAGNGMGAQATGGTVDANMQPWGTSHDPRQDYHTGVSRIMGP